MSEVFIAVPDGSRRAALLELASRGPVNRMVLPSGRPAWLVTGDDEARSALTDTRLSRGHVGTVFPSELPEFVDTLQGHLLNRNPPDHTRLRKLITAAFTRRRVDSLTPDIETISTTLIDDMLATLRRVGHVDLASDYAFPLPFRVICALLGISWEGKEDLVDWFTVLAAGSVKGVAAYGEASGNMLRFLRQTIEDKRRDPGDDLVSTLIEARDGTDRLTEDELVGMVNVLFIAGHETTASLITNCVLALLRHPDQLAMLRERPALIDATVEETLRYDSVVQSTMPSIATESFVLGGRTIEKGDVVTVSPAAVSLGAEADRDRFDISRDASHLGFGHGIHYCVGAPLARLEARIALRHLIQRLPAVELADENLERLPSVMFNRLAALPIRVAAVNVL